MKLNMFRVITIAAITSLFSQCKPSNPVTPPLPVTALEITIQDESNSALAATLVTLYGSQTDWLNETNAIGSSFTNSSGKVTFSNLSSKKYYWRAEKSCRNNFLTTVTTTSNLVLNTTNKVTSVVFPSGTIKLQNNSANPYAVYLNGVLYSSSMAGGTTNNIYYAPANNYTIRVLQLSGYVVYPTDKTYTGSVVCGGTLTVSFP